MLLRPDLIVPLILFLIVTLFTPGPNNLMLMTSGLNFGFKRTLAHMMGVAWGFAFLMLCVGLGLGAIFTHYPILYIVIKYAGAVYVLYLAWAIAKADPPDTSCAECKEPMNFLQACAFQWVNPKAWVITVGAVSAYAPIADYPYNMLVIAGMSGVLGIGSSASWAGLGTGLQSYLSNPKIIRAFNVFMAMLLAASLYPIFAEAWK